MFVFVVFWLMMLLVEGSLFFESSEIGGLVGLFFGLSGMLERSLALK